ncbi:conserved protein of unknown function [Magnetospirillum sp. XM-1]|uniref:hypothetical protein n=1 Tax=Magnetospirillum sp. XM-1 TaxID=1663591 RepID=UPI00073DEDB4|nr:hypothetical protein [Magnetospirillum sp. XM-1]CUW38694.1 conserved protein of unknown function [Magnetospirillum sp. XM-1]
MSIKNLEFSTIAPPKVSRNAMNTKTRARSKFIAAVVNQIGAVEAAISGKSFAVQKVRRITGEDGSHRQVSHDVQVRPWWFLQGDVFYLAPKYANQPLTLGANKSKPTVVCGKSLSDVAATLNTVKAAAEAGELDGVLEAQAITARKRMTKK